MAIFECPACGHKYMCPHHTINTLEPFIFICCGEWAEHVIPFNKAEEEELIKNIYKKAKFNTRLKSNLHAPIEMKCIDPKEQSEEDFVMSCQDNGYEAISS